MEAGMLAQLAEKVLSHPIKGGLIAYCPSMDLVAVVTTDEQAHIHRLNGQKVVTVAPRRGCSLVNICWKPNGSLLAVAYSDNSLSLIAAQGGKIVHQIQCPVSPLCKVTSVGWGVSFTDVAGIQALVPSEESDHTLGLDEVVHRGFIGEISQPKLDLPSDLASLDVESVLPKLSVLPAGGKEAEVFTTRTSLDALFHSKDGKSGSADALLVGFDDGSAWLAVHDFFEIGRLEPRRISSTGDLKVVKHAHHPYSSTQALLLERSTQGQHEVYYAPLELKLIGEQGRQFSLVASKSTQLLNVLRYVRESQVQIYAEFSASQTLPQRFVANVEEDLQEKEQTTFRIAVYHLVATGDCSPVVKEWLVDQLGDRGQKRWEKAAVSGYENTRKLLHENLLPALDRVNVLLARLKGLSVFQDTASAFGLDAKELNLALDTLRCLHLLSHAALIASDDELRKSISFCAWLKQEIDHQVTGPLTAQDEPDKEPTFDYAEIFEYLEGPLQRSSLYDYFDLNHESDKRETAEMPSENDDMYEAYKSALQKARSGQTLQKRLPGMAALIERLQKQCATIFSNIADAQQKKVRFGDLIPIGPCRSGSLDMRILQPRPSASLVSYVAVVSQDGALARIRRMDLLGTKQTSADTYFEEAIVSARPDGEIFDIKFIDDQTLCIGLKSGEKAQLIMLPYAADAANADELGFASGAKDLAASEGHLDLFSDRVQNHFVRHRFLGTTAASVAPAKIEVNGRKNRRALCIVAQDSVHYRIFDVDSFHAQDDGHDDGDDGGFDGEDIVMVH